MEVLLQLAPEQGTAIASLDAGNIFEPEGFIGKLGDGSGSYHWYYSSAEAPLTVDDVRADCGSDEFVEYFEYDPDADDFGPP